MGQFRFDTQATRDYFAPVHGVIAQLVRANDS